MRAAAFLDRDGVVNLSVVINGIPHPPSNISEVQILPGVLEAVNLLIENNYLPVVISNQPDIARKKIEPSEVQLINEFIGKKTRISNFYVCPHDDDDHCYCRKPKPGLIETATEELGIDLLKSFIVGDRWRDIEAGQAAGLPAFFIDYSYKELSPNPPYVRVSSLLEAVTKRLGI